MGECFIHRRGGAGSGKLYAVIAVTYPKGSACSCSNGSKRLTAKDLSGDSDAESRALFSIPEAGTWTVSCTDGSNSKSADVEITEICQIEQLKLTYSLVLFENGKDNTEITGGWTSISNGRVQVSATTYSAGVGETSSTSTTSSKNDIDLTGYSKLKFYDLQTSYTVYLGVDGKNEKRYYEDSGKDVEIDISSINSAQKIWMRITAYSNNGYNTETASVAKIELI